MTFLSHARPYLILPRKSRKNTAYGRSDRWHLRLWKG
nr:MAG TPA: hypothetical protein [Caudoviricetes sp.]